MSKASKAVALNAIEQAAAAQVPLTAEQSAMIERELDDSEPDPETPAEDQTIHYTLGAPEPSLVLGELDYGKAPTTPAPAETLPAYAARIERAAQPLAVCQITHPDAVSDAVFEGVFAGIRLVNGPGMSARLSDGSTI